MTKSDGPWAPYEPTKDNPWDLQKVAHLHRRAGFGGTMAELERDLGAGPDASVARFLQPREETAEEREVTASLRDGVRVLAGVGASSAEGLLALPHRLPPGRPPREDDALLAQPLRDQQ